MSDTPVSQPDDLVELGRIASAYGIKGWVKVYPHSAQAQVLLQAATWWLKAPPSIQTEKGAFLRAVATPVVSARMHSATVVALLEGVTQREEAQALKGHTVWVPRSQFPAPADDEYYWVDLIGCHFYGDDEGESRFIGVVTSVTDNGAHAVLSVARATLDESGEPLFSRDDKNREIVVLVPFVAAHVHTVDLTNKRLESDWPVQF